MAAVSIATLVGENGILTQASKSKEATERAEIIEKGRAEVLAWQTDKMSKGEDATLNDDIVVGILTDKGYNLEGYYVVTPSDYKVHVSKLYISTVEPGETDDRIYSVDEEVTPASTDIFEYERIPGTKNARIIRIKEDKFKKNQFYGYYDDYYDLNVPGFEDGTLVIPYEVNIDGEMCTITEVSMNGEYNRPAYPTNIKTVIYPNTVEKIDRIVETTTPSNASVQSVILSKKLIEIPENFFRRCKSLTKITIPNSVTSIGSWAFEGCSSLTKITIPNSVTSIGDYAFYDCGRLTEITIPNSVTSIGSSAFYGCNSLTEITIPNSVTSIGSSAFYKCNSLTKISIPNGVTSIEYGAFEGCTSLTEITIPNSVTSIGWSTFSGCSSLTEITIPNSVTSIGWSTFSGCSSLTEITIPNSVTSIGGSTFEECTSLTEITIPNSVTSIGANAFYDTPWYKNLPNGEIYIGKVFYEYKGSMPNNTNIIIKEGTTSITEFAFERCTSLTEITIPNSVTSIGNYAFSGCSSLTEITIPNSVTSIESSAFYGCNSLTEITIPNSVTSIGGYAFYACSSLTDINIKKAEGLISGAPWSAPSSTKINWNYSGE